VLSIINHCTDCHLACTDNQIKQHHEVKFVHPYQRRCCKYFIQIQADFPHLHKLYLTCYRHSLDIMETSSPTFLWVILLYVGCLIEFVPTRKKRSSVRTRWPKVMLYNPFTKHSVEGLHEVLWCCAQQQNHVGKIHKSFISCKFSAKQIQYLPYTNINFNISDWNFVWVWIFCSPVAIVLCVHVFIQKPSFALKNVKSRSTSSGTDCRYQ
jgi:hypothetical protein